MVVSILRVVCWGSSITRRSHTSRPGDADKTFTSTCQHSTKRRREERNAVVILPPTPNSTRKLKLRKRGSLLLVSRHCGMLPRLVGPTRHLLRVGGLRRAVDRLRTRGLTRVVVARSRRSRRCSHFCDCVCDPHLMPRRVDHTCHSLRVGGLRSAADRQRQQGLTRWYPRPRGLTGVVDARISSFRRAGWRRRRSY